MLDTKDPTGNFISILDIIQRPDDHVAVYMIRPGGVLPKCQPKGVKNRVDASSAIHATPDAPPLTYSFDAVFGGHVYHGLR